MPILRPLLGPRSSSFDRLKQFRMSLDRNAGQRFECPTVIGILQKKKVPDLGSAIRLYGSTQDSYRRAPFESLHFKTDAEFGPIPASSA
eukprot:11698327-Alexandrium_andersonii.AAC.1